MSRLDNTRPTERERLENMFYQSGMSVPDIASALNATQKEVRKALDSHGIKRANKKLTARYTTSKEGYVQSHGTDNYVYIHQLTAIAAGEDPHEVFDSGNAIHHKNGVKWDNRADNLELMGCSEHAKHHWENGDFTGENMRQYTDREMLDWIDSFVEHFGFVPKGADLKGWPGPTTEAYRYRFGKFTKAVKAAGYTPRGEK